MQRQMVEIVREKCEGLKKPHSGLVERLRSGSDLRGLVGWLVRHEHDTFICREVLACLQRPIDARTEAMALALVQVFSGCLSSRSCRDSRRSSTTYEEECSHVAKACKGKHLAIGMNDGSFGFFRLMALIVDVGALPQEGTLTILARGGGDARPGEVSALGVQTRIKNTYHNRGHQSDMLKKSRLNETVLFAVTKLVALAASGKRSSVAAVCTHGKHRSRMVSTIAGIVLKTLCSKDLDVHVTHNGK